MAEDIQADPALLLHGHPGWPAGLPVSALAAPALPVPRLVPIEAGQQAALEQLGIVLRKPPGPGNRLLLDAATPRQRLTLDFSRARNCTVLLGAMARLQGDVVATGAGHLLAVVGHAGGMPSFAIALLGRSALVALGQGVTCNRASLHAEGPEGAILLGDDAMLSSGIVMRSADSHAIIDLAAGAQVNAAAPIILGRHVWIGQGATVLKGVRLGDGAILAAQAVATRDVPARSLAGGVPARVLRQGVTWHRRNRPTAAEIAALVVEWGGSER